MTMRTRWIKVGLDDWRKMQVARGSVLKPGTFVYLTARGTIAPLPEPFGFVADEKTQRAFIRQLRRDRRFAKGSEAGGEAGESRRRGKSKSKAPGGHDGER